MSHRIAWTAPAPLLCLSLSLIGSPRPAAAQDKLSCQAHLAAEDCLKIEGDAWSGAGSLTLVAGCVACSGGGSNISCGGDDLVSAGELELRTAAGQVVSGTFIEQKKCVGVPLYRFDGALAAGSYNLIARLGDPHGDVLLLSFTVAGGSQPAADAGGAAPPAVDGGSGRPAPDGSTVPAADGGSPPPASDGASGDGAVTGAGDSGGCGCEAGKPAAPAGALPMVLLAAALIVTRRRRR